MRFLMAATATAGLATCSLSGTKAEISWTETQSAEIAGAGAPMALSGSNSGGSLIAPEPGSG